MKLLIDKPMTGRTQAILGVVGVVGSAVIWELLMRGNVIHVHGLPVPSDVLEESWRLLANAEFRSHLLFTLGEWLLGLAIATAVGVIVGGLMGAFRSAYVMFEYPMESSRVLPSIAIGPILILILAGGMLPLSLTVALACVWPILLNTMYGVRAADPVTVQTARSFGSTQVQALYQVKIPSALPFAFTGVRISASIGLIVAVSAELLIGSGVGIGGYVLTAMTTSTNMNVVYAATLIAGVMGVLFNLILMWLDGVLFAWKAGLAQ